MSTFFDEKAELDLVLAVTNCDGSHQSIQHALESLQGFAVALGRRLTALEQRQGKQPSTSDAAEPDIPYEDTFRHGQSIGYAIGYEAGKRDGRNAALEEAAKACDEHASMSNERAISAVHSQDDYEERKQRFFEAAHNDDARTIRALKSTPTKENT